MYNVWAAHEQPVTIVCVVPERHIQSLWASHWLDLLQTQGTKQPQEHDFRFWRSTTVILMNAFHWSRAHQPPWSLILCSFEFCYFALYPVWLLLERNLIPESLPHIDVWRLLFQYLSLSIKLIWAKKGLDIQRPAPMWCLIMLCLLIDLYWFVWTWIITMLTAFSLYSFSGVT